jgi:hypothetical protein
MRVEDMTRHDGRHDAQLATALDGQAAPGARR